MDAAVYASDAAAAAVATTPTFALPPRTYWPAAGGSSLQGRRQLNPRILMPLLLLLTVAPPPSAGLELSWLPADPDGPLPMSQNFRTQLATLCALVAKSDPDRHALRGASKADASKVSGTLRILTYICRCTGSHAARTHARLLATQHFAQAVSLC